MALSAYKKEWNRKNKANLAQYARTWRTGEKGKWTNLNLNLMRSYGITADDKQRMWDEQCGLCAVCYDPLPDIFSRDCQVEHDHKTNKVRALAHWYCNMVVGIMENHPILLSDVTNYLKRMMR